MNNQKLSGLILLLDSNRGIYIPQFFAENILSFEGGGQWTGVDPEDAATLRNGPDAEWYWDTWDSVLNNARGTIQGDNGQTYTYTLFQDGDLWAVCEELMTEEEKANFFGGEWNE